MKNKKRIRITFIDAKQKSHYGTYKINHDTDTLDIKCLEGDISYPLKSIRVIKLEEFYDIP